MYRLATKLKSFPEAQDTCKKWGGNLVMGKQPETRAFILKMYKNNHFWIGVKRDMKTRGFKYVDNTSLTKTYWAKGGPGNENCVSHRWPQGWKTESCSKKKLFLCHKSRFKTGKGEHFSCKQGQNDFSYVYRNQETCKNIFKKIQFKHHISDLPVMKICL